MIQHILVPIDFSEPSQEALRYATELATTLQARLTLLHVLQTPALMGGPELGISLATYMEQIETDMRQMMAERVQQARETGVACDGVLVHGVPFQHIIDTASEQQVDLIVMGTHGHTNLQHFFLGSVAEKVVRLAPCAVLVARQKVTAPAS